MLKIEISTKRKMWVNKTLIPPKKPKSLLRGVILGNPRTVTINRGQLFPQPTGSLLISAKRFSSITYFFAGFFIPSWRKRKTADAKTIKKRIRGINFCLLGARVILLDIVFFSICCVVSNKTFEMRQQNAEVCFSGGIISSKLSSFLYFNNKESEVPERCTYWCCFLWDIIRIYLTAIVRLQNASKMPGNSP